KLDAGRLWWRRGKVAGAQMLNRLLLSIGLLGLSVALAQAQPSPGRPIPEACQANPVETSAELEKRRQTLEREVSRQTAAIERTPKSKDGKAAGDAEARA